MIKVYACQDCRLVEVSSDNFKSSPEKIVWIDIVSPTQEEREAVEKFLSIKIPTKEEMEEIESSSRMYKENETLFMTVTIVRRENGNHKIIYNTFMMQQDRLATIRYDEIPHFNTFLKLAATKPPCPLNTSLELVLGMVEALIEKIADMLEAISGNIETTSQKIFVAEAQKNKDLREALVRMGLQGEGNSKTRDSLSSITRMMGFLKFNMSLEDQKKFENRLVTINLDLSDLKDHSSFLGHKISFILDATLGLINIEQNDIIKIFSIAAVVLLPPTLVASIYGMNFKIIPELNWILGYPFALVLMVVSAVLPYLYFKRRGWL